MQDKLAKFIVRQNAKLSLLMTVIFSSYVGMEAVFAMEKPNAANLTGLMLSFAISTFYAVMTYYAVRNELMDELMARLTSEGKENDSKHIDA